MKRTYVVQAGRRIKFGGEIHAEGAKLELTPREAAPLLLAKSVADLEALEDEQRAQREQSEPKRDAKKK